MLPEEKALANLSASPYKLKGSEISALISLFDRLRKVEDVSARLSPKELYEAHLATLGMMARTYQLMICAIEQVATGNINGFYVAVRGLTETLCALAWVNEDTERLPNLVQIQSPRIGAMLNAGYKKYSNLKSIYLYLSSIAHPGKGSHLLGFRPLHEREEKGVWTPFDLTISNSFAKQMLSILIVIAAQTMDEFEKLASEGAVPMRKGRLMAWVGRKQSNES